MTDSSRDRRKKITCIASEEGVVKAENALMRLGFESKSNFAKSQLISRSTVTKFFQCQPIQLDSFKRICEGLKFSNWKEIAKLPEEKESELLRKTDCSKLVINEEGKMIGFSRRQVTVVDKESKTVKAQVTLEGDINSVGNIKIIELILKEHSGDTIKIVDIQKGSIKLIIEGSQADIEKLVERIKSGELTEVNGFPIENIQISSENFALEESNELNDKWYLVREIVSQGANGQDLNGKDLSDADLNSVNLNGADLSCANLNNVDLSNAKLNGSDLSSADLSNANLSSADLSGAKLNGADLSGTNLSSAKLNGAKLGGAQLNGANFRNADLSNADFERRISTQFDEVVEAILAGKYSWACVLMLRQAKYNPLKYIPYRIYNQLIKENSPKNRSLQTIYSAELSGADFSGADFSGADFSDANVKNTRFGNSIGISEKMKLDLIRRGAIFQDFPGENSRIYSPIPSRR